MRPARRPLTGSVLGTVALVATAALVLAGCESDPDLASDLADVEAAAGVWTDPWVAPTVLRVPAPSGNGAVRRVAGARETTYALGVREAARAELALAGAMGWQVASASCGEEIELTLVRGSGTGAALASLVVTRERAGATASVEALVRHHLDTDWTVPAPADGSCLDGGSAPAYAAPPPDGPPLRADAPPERKPVSWERDEPSSAEAEALDALTADPGLAALGLTLSSTGARRGVNNRLASGASGRTELDLAGIVDALPGWELTFAACGGGPTRATFVDAARTATLAVSRGTGPGADTELTVVGPVLEGVATPWLDDLVPLTDPTCLAGGPVGDEVVHASGTPAALPSVLPPVRR